MLGNPQGHPCFANQCRRRQVIIREQLKFPSGFSTAVLISVLHGNASVKTTGRRGSIPGGFAVLAAERTSNIVTIPDQVPDRLGLQEESTEGQSWKRNVQLLLWCFFVSGLFTFVTYFFPVLRNIPIFGSAAATTWLWTLNPSLAYVGQGVIMGSATTLHMLLGAVVGWGILSPLAKNKGWAPGPVDDWENGSKGWIVWTSLSIMLADAVVSLGHLALAPALHRLSQGASWYPVSLGKIRSLLSGQPEGYTSVRTSDDNNADDPSIEPAPAAHSISGAGAAVSSSGSEHGDDDDEPKIIDDGDAPPDQQVGNRVVLIGLFSSILLCVVCTHVVFGDLVPLYANLTAVVMALVLSIMGVRALGETDLNPVSGISKLAQLFFAFVVPQSNKSSVLVNLIAGAVVSITDRFFCASPLFSNPLHPLDLIYLLTDGWFCNLVRGRMSRSAKKKKKKTIYAIFFSLFFYPALRILIHNRVLCKPANSCKI